MENQQIDHLSVFASGVYPVEVSVGKRVDARHRVPVHASVDVITGEVRFFVASESVPVLQQDIGTSPGPGK